MPERIAGLEDSEYCSHSDGGSHFVSPCMANDMVVLIADSVDRYEPVDLSWIYELTED